jgi:hypothetical protein
MVEGVLPLMDPENNARRVEFVAISKHSIGNYEAYVVTRKYVTHAETWAIVQTDWPKDEPNMLGEHGFQDREGHWWAVWHSFEHTNEAADLHQGAQLDDYGSGVWNGWNTFYGEL